MSVLGRIRAGMRLPEELEAVDPDAPEPRRKRLAEHVEEIVSGGFFLLMLITLTVGVFWRYVLDDPLLWTVNIGTVAFMWTIFVSNGLPNWDDDHIQFDLLYNRMPPRVQRWARIVSNLIVVVTFAIAIPAAITYLWSQRDRKVTGAPLTFEYAFGGILVFLVATVLHRGRLLVRDLRGKPPVKEGTAGDPAAASAPPEQPV